MIERAVDAHLALVDDMAERGAVLDLLMDEYEARIGADVWAMKGSVSRPRPALHRGSEGNRLKASSR